jgi:hypothetical protein
MGRWGLLRTHPDASWHGVTVHLAQHCNAVAANAPTGYVLLLLPLPVLQLILLLLLLLLPDPCRLPPPFFQSCWAP